MVVVDAVVVVGAVVVVDGEVVVLAVPEIVTRALLVEERTFSLVVSEGAVERTSVSFPKPIKVGAESVGEIALNLIVAILVAVWITLD